VRSTKFGDENGSIPGTFTHGCQTYMQDTHYICQVSSLLGKLTMTMRSLRDVMPCFLVLAIRLGFAYGVFGEDNGEAKHHVQHQLTERRPGGGRGHSTRLERAQACLEYIVLAEKVKESALNEEQFESFRRHLGTMEQLEEKGFGAFARWPTWRWPTLPKLALFGPDQLPEWLAGTPGMIELGTALLLLQYSGPLL
tara:strand:+ start:240 stop:827 length:588 start_codon:yes stop_codon:yes gene_type:complete